jgi:hypothetical protein
LAQKDKNKNDISDKKIDEEVHGFAANIDVVKPSPDDRAEHPDAPNGHLNTGSLAQK